MAYIETIHERDASGELAALYQRVGNPDGTVDKPKARADLGI